MGYIANHQLRAPINPPIAMEDGYQPLPRPAQWEVLLNRTRRLLVDLKRYFLTIASISVAKHGGLGIVESNGKAPETQRGQPMST